MAKATMGPVGTPDIRTYRAEGAGILRGLAVIQGTADDQVKVPAAVATGNLKVVGIAMEDAADGKPVQVCVGGECIAIAGAAVLAQDICKAAGVDGRLDPTTTDNDAVFGKAVNGAAADGDDFVFHMGGVGPRY